MNTGNQSGFDLDHLLEQELQRSVGGLQGPSPSVAQSAYHVFATGGQSMSILSSLFALASSKAAAALAAITLAVGGGSIAATAAVGSANPIVWGKTVTAAVAACKDQLKDGEHGIGQCVSAIAKQKGAEERASHSESGETSRAHPTPHPEASETPRVHPTPHPEASDVPKVHPSPHASAGEAAKVHPTGRPDAPGGGPGSAPSSVPTGSPATYPTGSSEGHPAGPPASPTSHRP